MVFVYSFLIVGEGSEWDTIRDMKGTLKLWISGSICLRFIKHMNM